MENKYAKERALKYLMETDHDDNNAIKDAYYAGYTDHAQQTKDKYVGIVEDRLSELKLCKPQPIERINELTDLLKQFKEI